MSSSPRFAEPCGNDAPARERLLEAQGHKAHHGDVALDVRPPPKRSMCRFRHRSLLYLVVAGCALVAIAWVLVRQRDKLSPPSLPLLPATAPAAIESVAVDDGRLRPNVQPVPPRRIGIGTTAAPERPLLPVDIYMESRCPDTTHFIERQLWPVFGPFNGHVQWSMVPFGKAQCTEKTGGGDFACTCQHGPKECELNALMNCVIEAKPDPYKNIPVIKCLQGGTVDSAAHCLEKGHLDAGALLSCASSAHGRTLLATAGERTARLAPPLHFVPTVVVGGASDPDAFNDLKGAICDKLPDGDKPVVCY